MVRLSAIILAVAASCTAVSASASAFDERAANILAERQEAQPERPESKKDDDGFDSLLDEVLDATTYLQDLIKSIKSGAKSVPENFDV